MARNPLYRWMLAYFLWMARLSSGARWGIVVGGYVGARFLSGIGNANPAWAPWIAPLVLLYFVFVLLTWFAVPFFSLLLRFNKFGWYALSRDQRRSSEWFGACLTAFAGSLVAYFAWDVPLAIFAAGFAVGMALPMVSIYNCDVGWPRQAMTLFAGAMALVGATAIAGAALGYEETNLLVGAFVIGFIATPWLVNYLVGVTPER